METTTAPPGTVAAILPAPDAVAEARRLQSDGVTVAEAAERLAGLFAADDLRAARDWWVRRMPRRGWDDPTPTIVLRILESALMAVDGLVPAPRPERRR